MKTLLMSWFGLAAFSFQVLGTDQFVDSATGLPTIEPTNSSAEVPATDMYHYTEADEVELQAALINFNQLKGEYQNLASEYDVINFKALDSGPDGCRIEMNGGLDYYLFGYKGLSDRYYSDVAVKKSADYTYTTANNSSRTIPAYTVCSSGELDALSQKRFQLAQAQLTYSKLVKNKSIKVGNAKALKANIESAENGEAYGLQRMAERYRKGDGVEQNLEKAADLQKKADEARQSEENGILVASQMSEESAAKQSFQRALQLADNGDYINAANVARFYRDGKGTDKDLNKALEYFVKAQELRSSAGYSAVPYSLQSEIDDVKKQLKSSDNTLP